MNKLFIHPAEGKNGGKRYLLSGIIIFIGFMIILGTLGYAMSLFIANSYNPKIVDMENLQITDPLIDLYLSHIIYGIWLLGIWICARLIHKRSLRSFVTPYKKISWKRIFTAFSIYFLIFFFVQLIVFAVDSENYVFNNLDWSAFAWLLAAAILLVPIQTTTEEIFFRGFLLQGFAKISHNSYFLSLASGIFFGVLHFANPEMNQGAVWAAADYIGVGILLSFLAVKTNSAEISIGGHAANNMFLCIFITSEDSVVGSIPSLFVQLEYDARLSTIGALTIVILFTIIMLYFHKRQNRGMVNQGIQQ
ncbi:CPBP family intramembrane glutamic endopeptidase [Metabacillus idriensis]|uniref:CPBP family intramembrane glutamic endopeptidase n=1 Tax=Metabacillus idriensis TaxID=324768 RepID=UPI00174E6DFF|nr:type II CAAX endopeptidase family protein [Metabacillus idriensis]